MSFPLTIISPDLVRWLKKAGCPKDLISHFHLERGMGERIDITVVNKTDIRFEFFDQTEAYGN